MTVLVVGSPGDPHVARVVAELEARNALPAVLDPYDAGAPGVQIQANGGLDWRIGAASDIAANAIKTVWWRLKPPFVIRNRSLADYYDANFAATEQAHALSALPGLLANARWINAPSLARSASDKVAQLAAATALGMRVPRTLVTNSASEVARFVAEIAPNPCVHKTFTPYFAPDGRQCFANIITQSDLDRLGPSIGACASIYQEFIRPQYELRVTVVGETIFPASIRKADDHTPDWRRSYDTNQTKSGTLDEATRDAIIAMQNRFDITFGCYDFVVDAAGTVFFLEVNPAGQWLWIEDATGLPISAALAELLAQ